MSPLSASARRSLWLSTLLILGIMAVLIRQWPQRSLWYDETVNAYFAEHSWSESWEWCTHIDNQMPLHFALLKAWSSLAGTSEFSLRALSVGCAGLSLAGIIALGRRLGGRAAGWLAALALALSQSFVYAAYEVRPYALALALFAGSSMVLWDLWGRYTDHPLDRRYVRRLALYELLALALLYTHYTAWVALAAHGLYVGGHTLYRRTPQRVLILAHLGIGLALGYLPWLLALSGRDVRAGTAYAGRIAPPVALRTYLEFYAYAQRIVPYNTLPYALAALLLMIGAISGWMAIHRPTVSRQNGLTFALLILAVPLAGLVLMVYSIQAKLSGRHGWPVWIGIALLFGIALASLARWRWLRWPIWIAALAGIALPGTAHYQPVYNSYLREAFEYVNEHAEAGDVLVLHDGTLFAAASYYHARIPWIGLPPDRLTNVTRFLFFDEAIHNLETLTRSNNARRVWVISWQGHIMDPQNLVEGILDAIGERQPLEGSFGFGDVSVTLYRLRDHPLSLYQRITSLQPVAQTPPNGPIYYGGYVINQRSIPHGGIVEIQTWWKRGAAVMPGMRVSVRLYDATGSFYAQFDQPPVSPSFGQENWQPDSPILSRFMLWVPPTMPPGPAEVRMLIYDMDGTFEPITVPVAPVEIRD